MKATKKTTSNGYIDFDRLIGRFVMFVVRSGGVFYRPFG